MKQLIFNLQALDRKERFAVLRDVLGFDQNTPCLDDCFRYRLSSLIDTTVPKKCFCAMDYHLDWIRLALHLAERPELGFGNEKCIKNPFCDYNKNQRDVDLLVAFPADCDSQVTHLVMIEAKAYSSWENDQLKAKAETLKCIFGKDGKRRNKVLPYFVLMSDKEPERVNVDCWPEWMTENKKKPIWLKYKLPRRKQAVRCDPQGKNSANGGHLRLDDVGSCQEQTDELVKQAS